MNDPGILVYQCQRCNELEKSIHVPNCILTLICLGNNHPLPKEWFGVPVSLIDVHHCKDGHLGLSKLIGAELDSITENNM
jgi:hypothetical protein